MGKKGFDTAKANDAGNKIGALVKGKQGKGGIVAYPQR
jgi:hypothetical protein